VAIKKSKVGTINRKTDFVLIANKYDGTSSIVGSHSDIPDIIEDRRLTISIG
jgi:hypothetical protein